MGASVSALPDNLQGELKDFVDLTEKQKMKVAEHDLALLETEVNKMFKGHNNIIDELTGRSKKQIRRLLTTFPAASKHLDTLIEGGNHYAKFIKQLAISKEEIEMDLIRTIDYDEELFINIIGTSSLREIETLCKLYEQEKTFPLTDLFQSKCKSDSLLLKFLLLILEMNRDESKVMDKDLAARQADIIHKAGAARLIGFDEEPIFEILGTASRAQCFAINEAYQQQFDMKLEKAINMKFKGSVGKLLVMWSQPIPHAIVTCLNSMIQRMVVDKVAVATFIAKYDKDILSIADNTCKQQYGKTLQEHLGKGVSGTVHRALKGWIESPSPDKGFERILDLYVDSKLQAGMTLAEICGEPDLRAKLAFLLTKQGQELKLFMIDHKLKVESADQVLLSKSSAVSPPRSSFTLSDSSNRLRTPGGSFTTTPNSSVRSAGGGNSSRTPGGSFVDSKKKSRVDVPNMADLAIQETEDGESSSTKTDTENEALDSPSKKKASPQKIEDSSLGRDSRRQSVDPLSNRDARRQSVQSTIQEDEDDFDESAAPGPTLGQIPAAARMSKLPSKRMFMVDHENKTVTEKEINKVYAYLTEIFEEHDSSGEGSLEVDQFWAIVGTLPLSALGYTPEEVDLVKEENAWDMDGVIFYFEALLEFSESIAKAIQDKEEGDRDVNVVIDRLKARSKGSESAKNKSPESGLGSKKNSSNIISASAASSKAPEVVETPPASTASTAAATPAVTSDAKANSSAPSSPPKDLDMSRGVLAAQRSERKSMKRNNKIPNFCRQYIFDTINAFDYNNQGYLTAAEIDSLLQTLNVPSLTSAAQLLENNQDKMELKALAKAVTIEMEPFFNDGLDHYFCFIDKSSGAYFWFNALDNSSQWVDYGDASSSATTDHKDQTESKASESNAESSNINTSSNPGSARGDTENKGSRRQSLSKNVEISQSAPSLLAASESVSKEENNGE